MGFFLKIFGNEHSRDSSDKALSEGEIKLCNKLDYNLLDAEQLKAYSVNGIEKFEFEESESESEDQPDSICISVPEKTAKKIIRDLQENFIRQDQFLYIGRIDDSTYLFDVVLAKTNDPYKILRYTGTNGINHGLETEDIVSKLKSWDKKYGIMIYSIGTDFIDLRFLAKDIDREKLAAEILEFCPDSEDIGEIESKLKKNGEIYFWWD